MGPRRDHNTDQTEDSSAFAAVYREHVDAVYRYCYFRLGSREQAEDATSQIFLKALAAFPKHRQPASARSWLFRIAHNTIVDLYRARRFIRPLADMEAQPDGGRSPEDEALISAERDEVRRMLLVLPADQRRVLELRLAGLNSAEIGNVLGKRQGAVKMAQSRAIARLREELMPGVEHEIAKEQQVDVIP